MRFQFTPMVKNLLIINIGIFLISIIGLHYFHIDLNAVFGLHSWFSDRFRPWQFVTYIFMHSYWDGYGVSFGHVLRNMFGLIVFGPMLEQRWGVRRFLFFYLFTGIGAGLLYWGVNTYETANLKNSVESYIAQPTPEGFSNLMKKYDRENFDHNIDYVDQFHYHPDNQSIIDQTVVYASDLYKSRAAFSMVGASGAIFGILMAFAMLFPNTELYYFFIPVPIKAKYIVAVFGLYELWAEYAARQGDNVAHFAHLAGMFFGFILIKYWQKQRNTFY